MSMARDIDSICARLAELEVERSALNEQLEQLRAQRARVLVCGSLSSITANSTAAEKITLFVDCLPVDRKCFRCDVDGGGR
jgi:ABC-type phosphate transport system auxiliary subunit